MNLDPPPMLEHLLLESPWAAMGVLLIAAIVLALASRRRRSKAVGLCALAALSLSAGVYVLARTVATGREQLIQSTHALVSATAPLDPATLDRLIDPRATVSGPDGAIWLNDDQIIPRLKRVVGRFGVQSQRIHKVQAISRHEGWGESTVIIRTQANGLGGIPINTGWHLSWQKDDGAGNWRVVDIRWMRFNGQEVNRGMLP